MDATNPAFTETDAPVVVVASDASMGVVAVPTGQSAKPVVMGFMDAMCRGARPLVTPRPMDEQVAELRDAAKADPVLARMFPSLGV